MLSLFRLLSLARRAANYAGVLAIAAGAWSAVEQWYYDNFSSNPSAAARMAQGAELLLTASNILKIGGFDFAWNLYRKNGITIEVFVRVALLHAASRMDAMPPAANKIDVFKTVFKSELPSAFAVPDVETLIIGLCIRELENNGLVDFYNTSTT